MLGICARAQHEVPPSRIGMAWFTHRITQSIDTNDQYILAEPQNTEEQVYFSSLAAERLCEEDVRNLR